MASRFFFIQQTIRTVRYSFSSQALAVLGLGLLASFSLEATLTGKIAYAAPLGEVGEGHSLTQATTSTILYVDPQLGNDRTADGSQLSPFRTINRALEVAPSNSVIQLAPGTYSAETGETFPISLKPHVVIQGNPATKGQDVILQGGSFFTSPSLSRQNITILGGANRAGLVGVTVSNPNPSGYSIHIESSNPVISNNTFTGNEGGILVGGNSASLIENNFFYANRSYGVRIHGSSYPTIKGNLFEQSGTAILVNDHASPLILGNRITQSKSGIVAQGRSQPQLRDNFIEGNEEYGLLALEQAKPDYSPSDEEPSNAFRNNGTKNIALHPVDTSNSKPKRTVEQPAPSSKASAPTPTASPLKIPKQPHAITSAAFPTPSAFSSGSYNLTAKRQVRIVPVDTLTQQPRRQPSVDQPTPQRIVRSTVTNPPAIAQSAPSRTAQTKGNFIVPTIPTPAASSSVQAVASVYEPIPAPPAKLPLALSPLSRAVPEPNSVTPIPIVGISPLARGQKTTPPRPTAVAPPGSITQDSISPNPARSPVTTPRAIPIPVPAPATKAQRSSASVPVKQQVSLQETNSPLEDSSLARSPTNTRGNTLLPVPGPNIPVGNIGNMPSVYAEREKSQNVRLNRSVETASNARYRVVVIADNQSQQEQIRAIAPDAFPTTYQGRRVLQAGAFGDPSKATQLASMLMSQGLQATIESLK